MLFYAVYSNYCTKTLVFLPRSTKEKKEVYYTNNILNLSYFEKQRFDSFSPFVIKLSDVTDDNGTLVIPVSVIFGVEPAPEHYRLLAKIQLGVPGCGRNPGLMRNYLSPSIPDGQSYVVSFVIPIPAEAMSTYQIHMRYLLLDIVTGYRSQYHTMSTLAAL